ncbi:MAG: glycosyltransferase [Bdellovibrionaceae bacterium]|nr:glycosyltransferase [Pseudobdellovibrionaceae bacterium]MBX3032777.1 glycosyltransferase [Pseudobdellovibrionaceae bacterium]
MTPITIGLVVRNEESRLLPCLRSLVENHLRPFRIRIVMVDNHSSDGTLALAEEFLAGADVPFQIIRRQSNHLAAARNDVLRAAAEGFVAFTDADCRVPADWVARLAQRLASHPEAAAVGGGNQPPTEHPFRASWELLAEDRWLHHGSVQARHQPLRAKIRAVPHLSTCNVMYRLSALQEVRGFSARHERSGEDLDLSYRLRRRGWRLLEEPRLSVEHHIPDTMGLWLKQCWKYGMDQVPVLARHGFIVDPRRSLFVSFVMTYAAAGMVNPWLWSSALMHPAWFFIRARRQGLARRSSYRAALWTTLTHGAYAFACLGGVGRLLREPFRRQHAEQESRPMN